MSPASRLPRDVSVFLREHLQSITQLDLLLLLHTAPDRRFTATEVSRELRIPERMATGQLLDLARSGVLVAEDTEPPCWRFDPAGEHARVVSALAEVASKRRRAVHDLILSEPSSDVQLFSDAFRL